MAILVGAQVDPWVMRHINGRALIVAGALVAAAGFWRQSDITPHSGYLSAILGPAIVIAFGGGLLNTPVAVTWSPSPKPTTTPPGDVARR